MHALQRLFRNIKYIVIEIQMPGIYEYIYEDTYNILTLLPGDKVMVREGHPHDLTYIGR